VIFAGRRVLVVEDEFLVSLTTIEFLECAGCEVVGPATTVAMAMQFVETEFLDAAVLDINISGDTIWPVAEALRRKGVPCLFLSAYSPLSEIPELFKVAPRLEKPLEQKSLLCHLSAIWGAECEPVSP